MSKWIGQTPQGESVYQMPDGSYSYGTDASGWKTSRVNPIGSGPPAGGSGGGNSIGGYGPPLTTSRYSTDYQGSYDEWVYRTARAMAENYARGIAEWEQFSGMTAGLGQPNQADFGSAANGSTGYISESTYDFFVRYVERYGMDDPYIQNTYGAPPQRRATYGQDPNDPAARDAASRDFEARENALDREFTAGENAADRAHAMAIATMQEAGATARVAMQVENDWKIAVMRDATDRYIAEGNWGVQKYIAELQEAGAMDRLKLELGMRDKELAQRAIEEKNRHHENMVSLALEVAKYDAELAAEPRNWIAYAAWLGQRDTVINGLTLSMAADLVPEDQAINALAMGGQSIPGSGVAMQMSLDMLTGASGGSAQPGVDPFAQTAPISNNLAQNPQGTQPLQPAGIDLQSTNYGDIAKQLLGLNPAQNAAGTGPPSTNTLQQTYNSTQGNKAGFSAWKGPTTNALGMQVDPQGHKVDYRQWSDMFPSIQEMRLGAVQSVGKWLPDYGKELERSRPKGGASGSVSWG